ncbi:MAG: 30S ribosomal protein S2 [Silvanigrellaceae bacterium]|nr:30S ribosomal protein S2 [Silvanigrellaceae bacterium]
MATEVHMRELLDAGVHFGHQVRRWNPRMRPFIYGERNGIHIIDLQKTQKQFKDALNFIENTVAEGGHVLFVATKKQAQEIIIEEASRAGMFHIHHRWLGGMMTNWSTVKASITKLKRIEKMANDGTYENITKREVALKERLREKLERSLGGIKNMPGLPSVLFVIDAKKEFTAIAEANRLGIPVVAVTDTNSDPSGIDFVIPGNDDSLKAIKLYASLVAEASLAGRNRRKAEAVKEDSSFSEGGRGTVKVKRLKSRDEDDAAVGEAN